MIDELKERCVRELKTHTFINNSINQLQKQFWKYHQMKDGSVDWIVNMLKQVECMVVDSLVSVKVEHCLPQFDCKVLLDWLM